MNTFDFGAVAGLGTAATLLFLLAWAWAYRRRRAAKASMHGSAKSGETHVPDTGSRRSRSDERIAALETLQTDLAARIDALVSAQSEPEERLQALASQILSLIRDKNATFDTALAGLDQLRARMRTLEQVGNLAEARELLDEVTSRFDGLQSSQAADMAALARRIDMLETPGQNPFAEISAQLTQLYAQKDDAIETLLNRVGPLESRLAEIEGRGADIVRMETSLEALQEAQNEQRDALSALCAGVTDTQALTDGIAALRNQKAEIAEDLVARLDMIERQMVQHDPQALLDRFSERLEALRDLHAAGDAVLKDRITALEAPGESPFAEISEQLTRLYAQKDAAVETVFARLAPLEAKLDALESGLSEIDSREGIVALREQIRELGGRQHSGEAVLQAKIETLVETQAATRSDFAALRAETVSVDIIAQRLEGLLAQKDALSEVLMSRMRQLEDEVAANDPGTALDRFSERLETLKDRVTSLEAPGESPFAEISEQLTRLYVQKDATVEAVFARLAPLEAKLDMLESGLGDAAQRDQFDGLTARLDALDWVQDELADRLGGVETAAGEAATREVSMRLAPLETKLSALEEGLAAQDPRGALDRFSARLEGLKDRITALEAPGESPFAEISEQLTRLYAQKDATVETVFARLAPLETKLSELESGLAAQDPRGALDRFSERLETLKDRITALEAPGESPFAEISEQLTRLYAQKDATVETVFARLAPLETKLSELESGLGDAVQHDQLDGLTARLDALDWVQDELADRLGGVRAAVEIAVETTAEVTATKLLSGQLAPLQARMAEMEDTLAAQDPRGVLDRFSERLETLKDRVTALETPDESPLAELSEQLTELYAHKDATLETMSARLAPLEAKLDVLESGLGEAVQREQLDGLTARLDTLAYAQEVASERLTAIGSRTEDAVSLTGIRKMLSQAFAGRDANIDTLLKRLAPLEARLAKLEERPWDPDADMARAQAQEVAMQMIAARAAAEHTELFADRLALLEATLPRLSATQTILMQSLDGREGASEMAGRIAATFSPAQIQNQARRDAPAEGRGEAPDELGAIHAMPRVISLHQR